MAWPARPSPKPSRPPFVGRFRGSRREGRWATLGNMTFTRPPAATGPQFDPRHVGVLLGVWAHPDDEAYLSAGLMASVRAAGHRVVVATATPGKHGTDHAGAWRPARLAALRTQELHADLAALGVDEHRWLGHEDGTLGGLD